MPQTKRLFFAAEIAAAWPQNLPVGRLIAEEFRHMTFVFLGNKDVGPFDQIPLPQWIIGPSGLLNQWIFLPEKDPRVVAASPVFFEGKEFVMSYYQSLSEWTLENTNSQFLPHISISRNPFDENAWKSFPCQIPFFIRGVALFNSLGHSKYEMLWQKKSQAPFEEIQHTADIAYQICGQTFSQILYHATLALAFSFPAFIHYLGSSISCSSIEEVIGLLNSWVAEIDTEEGIGLKAVSYHATVQLREDNLLYWTMIVDV